MPRKTVSHRTKAFAPLSRHNNVRFFRGGWTERAFRRSFGLVPPLLSRATVVLAVCSLYPGGLCAAQEGEDGKLYEPPGLMLTWQGDPTTTMTIDWHTVAGEALPRPPSILFREAGSAGEWVKEVGTFHPFPYTRRTIKRVELTGLEPGTYYEFRIGPDDPETFPESRTYTFRTMPADPSERAVRFVTGGDTGYRVHFRNVSRAAVEQDPDFVALGGDLAYADGGHRDFREGVGTTEEWWRAWFDIVSGEMVTEEGRVIPVLAAIGNHEVWRGYTRNHPDYEENDAWRERLAPIFYHAFAFPGQPGYAALDFGEYLSMIFLDTAHSNPIEGQQTEWLDRALADRSDRVRHVFPIYHVASYPSWLDFDGREQTKIREHWGPLFDRYGLEIVFENHDHAYKQTYPIRGGEIHPEGVVYMGDGAFGMSGGTGERLHDADETWYLKRVAPDRHFHLVEIDEGGFRITSINVDGEILGEYHGRERYD